MLNKRVLVSRHAVRDVTILILYIAIRTVKYAISDVDGTISDYENKLRELKSALLGHVTLQAGVTVGRMGKRQRFHYDRLFMMEHSGGHRPE